MTMETNDLIYSLAADAKPVSRLAQPAMRALLWFGLSIAYAGIASFFLGFRADLDLKLTEPSFLLELAAVAHTSLMAAAAAFCATCPGRPKWERFAPLPFLALWLATLGHGCWQDWVQLGPSGLAIHPDLVCLPIILALSIAPGVLIFVMIKRGAPLAPFSTTALGTLAAASVAAVALRLTHVPDASIMVLVWQFGSVGLLTALTALFGRRLLRWPNTVS